jgi:hypothetical protein
VKIKQSGFQALFTCLDIIKWLDFCFILTLPVPDGYDPFLHEESPVSPTAIVPDLLQFLPVPPVFPDFRL